MATAQSHTAQRTKRFDVFYVGDCVAESVEAATAQAACDDYATFAANFSPRINADWLVARPARADEFKEQAEDA